MQKTLLKKIQLDGFGFWQCQDCSVILEPSEENSGIVFIRDDQPTAPPIPAILTNRIDTPHRTSLGITQSGVVVVKVEMVEHIMAALCAMEVSNCKVHVSAEELPALDGSAESYVKAISQAGVVEQNSPRTQWRIKTPIRVGDDKFWLEVVPPEPEVLVATISYELDYPQWPSIGHQEYSAPLFSEALREQIMPARTFATQQEAVTLQAAGLCKRVTPDNCLVFSLDGVIKNTLRFEDECARHKILDFVGDLFLDGIDWIGKFRACGSGHSHNYLMLNELIKQKNQIF